MSAPGPQRFAVVSDIHGNLVALDAVIADLQGRGIDVVWNLGDLLSGPLWPAQTADRLMALGWPTIRGNHERQVLHLAPADQGESDRHAAAELRPAHRAWLEGLPGSLRPHDDVLCCHGTPTSDLIYLLETVTDDLGRVDRRGASSPGLRQASDDEVLARLGAASGALVLCGHTHLPRARRLRRGPLVVNPGSVGLPAYDDAHPHPHLVENGSPHARYAVVERRPAGWTAALHRVAYDWEAAARQAECNGRGDWADALRTGWVGRRETDVTAGGAA